MEKELEELECFEKIARELERSESLTAEFWKEQNNVSKQSSKEFKEELQKLKITPDKFRKSFNCF